MTLPPGSPVPVPATGLPRLFLARDHDPATVAARVRTGVWERVGRGVYVAATRELSPRQAAFMRIAAVHENLRTPHWFSHQSAAVLWGLPLWRTPDAVHVRRLGRVSARRDRSTFHHRGDLSEERLTVLGRFPVTNLEQTMVDCARRLPPLDGLVVADAALRAGADRATALAMLDELRGRNGVARARVVIGLADEGAESPGETATRFVVLREGLPRPETQVTVGTELGTLWSDLGWAQWRALLEYDGRVKYRTVEDLVREKRRQDALVEAGFRLLRVTKEDLRSGANLALRASRLLPADLPRTPRPLLRG